MRARIAVALFLLFITGAAFGKDVYIAISGQAGVFFADARILNPSFDKDIVISARYLQNNSDNSGVAPVTINVPKRTQLVLDNVVANVFHAGGLGAIRLTCDDDFVATQRIYAQQAVGTLGQFSPGLDVTTALKKGVLPQLKQSSTFRTNMGGVNPNAAAANVTFKLYDKNNAVVQTKTFTFQPFGVLTPNNIGTFFADTTHDLSDSWISYDSDQPIFMYGSVVDNSTTDPTYIPASADSGTQTAPAIRNVTIVASDFKYTVTGTEGLAANDQVKFTISTSQGTHGFRLVSPGGQNLIDINQLDLIPVERTVTLNGAGTYFYFCTFTECGIGHTTMTGELVVGDARSPGGGPKY